MEVTSKENGNSHNPDVAPEGKLSRIRPMKIIRGSLDGVDEELLKEMTEEWERDWAEL